MEVGENADGNPGPSDRPFRRIPSELYYYGYDENAKVKTRLIVKEKDQNGVREYDVEEDGTNYYCIGCLKKSQTKKYAYFDDDHFLLAPTHHECDPVPLVESDFDQEMKTTMFLQAQSQPRSSMSLYTSSAMGNKSTTFANTSSSSSKKIITPINLLQPAQPPPEVVFDGTRGVNKFSAALLNMSNASSPEYIPETSPSTSTPTTPVNCSANNPLFSNSVMSSLAYTSVLETQAVSSDISLATADHSTPINDVQIYNTAETPLEIRHVQKSEKERRCAETPDSVYGHYLFNGFAAKSEKLEKSEGIDVSTPKGSATLKDALTVDVGTPSDEDNIAIPRGGYEFGYSWRTGTANKRIIVFEPNDRTKVKQYAGNGSYFWFCIDCFRIKKKKYKSYFDGDTFMAARTHFCEPIEYDIAMHQQQEIIEKFGLNKTTPVASEDFNQNITETGQDTDNESVGPSRISKRIRIAKDRSTPEVAAEEINNSIPDYTYLNSLEKRPVKPQDYQYGVGYKNQPNGRIIVFEENDRSYCREYSRDHKTTWYCRYCLRSNKKLYAFLKENIFFVPPSHNCMPKLYTEVMREQQEIRMKYAAANVNSNLLSPGISLSNVAPVKPGVSSALSSPRTPISIDRSPRQRSLNSQSSSFSSNQPSANVLPVASIEIPVKPVTEREVRQRQRTRTPKNIIQQPSKSTFIPVFSSTSQPISQSNSLKYREVDALDYQYGFNEHGDFRKRLIVYEEDRRYCREYNKSETDRWKCVNCKYGVARKDDEKFVVTLKHDCNPISVKKSKELQALYKAKSIGEGKFNVDGADRSETASRSSIDFNPHLNLRDKRPSSSTIITVNSSLREVHEDDWEYGLDTAGEKEKRIIVFEPNTNHVYAREFRNDAADTRLHARWNENKLYVPYADAHCCQPRLYEDIQKKQEKIEFGRKRGRSAERSLRSKRARITAEDTDTSNSPIAADFDESFNAMDTSEISQPKRSVVSAKIQNMSSNVQPFFTPASAKIYGPSNTVTTINYYNPSAFFLAECCKKLNIKYTSVAYRFWSNIDFEQVSPSSRPLRTFPTTESMYHGFSCFSLYLTGNESNTIIIREMINRYVYNNFKSLGECMGHDFSQFNHETPLIREALWSFSLTEIHLECLSRWFDCRIGIFDNGQWKRYGNWDDEDCDVLTFVVEHRDGKYNPVLSLTV